jgi:hypothetical protein
MTNYDDDMGNYNKVKDIVVSRICTEGYMTEEEAEEFKERNQVLLYKGKWFSKWFKKNVSVEGSELEGHYMRIIQMRDKELNSNDTSIRNRKIKAGVYRNVFKKLLMKDYSDIMEKHEIDFSEVIFNSVDSELLDCINIIFKDVMVMERYKREHKTFLDDANNIAKTIGFYNGVILTIED